PVAEAWLPGGIALRVLALAAGVPAVTALCFGVAPAGAGLRRNLHAALTVGERATAGRYEGEMRRILVVVQFTGSMVLLVGAGLLLRAAAPRQDAAGPGFDPSDTLTLRLDVPAAGAYADPARRAELYLEVLERLAAVPGVRAAGVASPDAWLGMGPAQPVTAYCGICYDGSIATPIIKRDARHLSVGPGWFSALKVPLLAGREFTAADRAGAEPVAVVSRQGWYRLFMGTPAVGKRLRFGDVYYRVVGIVDDVAATGPGSLEAPRPAVYFSALQHPPRVLDVAVRTAGDPAAHGAAVAAAIAGVEPRAALSGRMAMAERLERHRAPLRWFAWVMAVVAGAALLLGGGGLYGVMAFAVARRTREIGVRVALGARRGDVIRMVVGQALRLVALSVFAGSLGAVSLGVELRRFFPGLLPVNPWVHLGVALLLTAIALAATIIPARRAASVDPMTALQAA
ncbi:MAG TPA: FtsX-like permease family protein, partial [Longimicrobiaceae bacterium]|nr:FtsX-like permease family protein [Longimicrobiaceae bacterium]